MFESIQRLEKEKKNEATVRQAVTMIFYLTGADASLWHACTSADSKSKQIK